MPMPIEKISISEALSKEAKLLKAMVSQSFGVPEYFLIDPKCKINFGKVPSDPDVGHGLLGDEVETLLSVVRSHGAVVLESCDFTILPYQNPQSPLNLPNFCTPEPMNTDVLFKAVLVYHNKGLCLVKFTLNIEPNSDPRLKMWFEAI